MNSWTCLLALILTILSIVASATYGFRAAYLGKGVFPHQSAWAIGHPIVTWLRHGDSHRRLVPTNRLGWVSVGAIVDRYGLTMNQLCTLAYHDRKRRFEF